MDKILNLSGSKLHWRRMFLSIYASYYARAARMDKRMYILAIVISAILMSALSTFYCFSWFGWFFSMFFFSFPFFYISQGLSSEWNIFFFNVRLFSASPTADLLGVFAFFLLVNLCGVGLGHLFHKRLEGAEREVFSLFSRNFVISLAFFFLIAQLSFLAGGLFLFVYWWFPIISSFFWIPAAIAALIEILRKI